VNSKGHSVALTIDRNIQHVAESELQPRWGSTTPAAAWPWSCPRDGGDPRDGDSPSFNPNAPPAAPAEARKNRSLTDSFEPGSTFKVFTLASALELGAVSATDRFFCENGSYPTRGR